MFGGSGTTANTFAYLLWAVLRQLDVQMRLRKELKEAFPDRTRSSPDAAVRIIFSPMNLVSICTDLT